MAYVLQFWEQPADLPMPSDIYAISELVDRLADSAPGQNPLFIELAKRVTRRYPCILAEEGPGIPEEEWATKWAWTDAPIDGRCEDGVYGLGLNRNMLDEVRPFVIVEANAIGLNVMDDQAAEVHLADGTVISPHAVAQCVKGLAAFHRGEYELAVAEFSRHAGLGNPSAQYHLGVMYSEGIGTCKSRTVASALWTVAAMADSELKSAADGLAGQLTPKQVDAALLLTRAMRLAPNPLDPVVAHLRAREATYRRGCEAMDNNNHALVLESIQPLAEDGHSESQFMMGLLYGGGLGVTTDKREAAGWYRKSAESGFAWAQHNLACMLANGDGVEQNEKEAAKWYRLAAKQGNKKALAGLEGLAMRHRDWPAHFRRRMEAAQQGNVGAQYEIGEMYLAGKGVALDEGEALRWFLSAAEGGHPDAQFALASWSYTGEKLPKDIAKAVRWYRLASANGNPPAQHNLGALYLRGEGVPKSRIVGLALQMSAKFNGHESGHSIQFALGEVEKVHALIKNMKQPSQFLSAIDAYRDDEHLSNEAVEILYGKEIRNFSVGGILVLASMAMTVIVLALRSFHVPMVSASLLVLAICTGAYGATRVVDGLGGAALTRGFYAVLMAVPPLNLFVGFYLVLRAYLGWRALRNKTPAVVNVS